MHRILTILIITLVPAMSVAADYKFGSPIKEANLTLVPVYPANPLPKEAENYMTFSEASDKNLIEVTELNGNTEQARVSEVHVTSKANQPIILLAGEVILGGKQDRVISANTILEPRVERLEVSVFCVEQGRWDNREAGFRASKSVAHGDLRSAAVFEEDQQRVWEEVSKQNDKTKVAPSTGTYRATLDSAPVAKKVKKMTSAVLRRLAADKEAIGVVAAIDGEIRTVDAFANPNLFARVRRQIVTSYVLAAVTSESPDNRDLDPEAIAGLNDRINDDSGAEARMRGSGEAETVYQEKRGKKKAVTRSKSGDKVHEYINFE